MNQIICSDCIEAMRGLPAGGVDLVVADLPYGQTQNAWDVPVPFDPMWAELRRVTKMGAAIVLFAAQPFAARLICSNTDDFRYDLIWRKNKPTGFLNSKKQPLRAHEHILMFYRKPPFFDPQMTEGHKPMNAATQTSHGKNYGAKTAPIKSGGSTQRYPTSIIDFPIINNDDPDKHHPTQKPVGLYQWLIRSYSKPGDIVLDFTAGAGTAAIAAMRENRKYICIEKSPEYVEITERRVASEIGAAPLLATQ